MTYVLICYHITKTDSTKTTVSIYSIKIYTISGRDTTRGPITNLFYVRSCLSELHSFFR